MMSGQQGQCGDHRGVGTMWGGDNGDHSHGGCENHMGTFWGMGTMWGQCGMMWGQRGDEGDDMGMTGTTWGPRGPCVDNEITKSAIALNKSR